MASLLTAHFYKTVFTLEVVFLLSKIFVVIMSFSLFSCMLICLSHSLLVYSVCLIMSVSLSITWLLWTVCPCFFYWKDSRVWELSWLLNRWPGLVNPIFGLNPNASEARRGWDGINWLLTYSSSRPGITWGNYWEAGLRIRRFLTSWIPFRHFL